MDSLFQKFLSDAESAGLSEGDYLKACNALKQAFETTKTTPTAQPEQDRYHRRIPLNVEINNHDEESSCGFVFSFTFHEFLVTRGTNPNEMMVSYDIDIDGATIKEVRNQSIDVTESYKLLRRLITASQTHAVYMKTSDMARVRYEMEEVFKNNRARDKIINSILEYDDEDTDCCYTRSAFGNIMADIIEEVIRQYY
jgi:hypothetical protein